MILYQCLCGSTFLSGKLHKKTGKDGKTKYTYFGSETERKAKVEWKLRHGTHRGCYLNKVDLYNMGHGYTRSTMRRSG